MNKGNLDKPLAPFSCQYTPQVPELLLRLNCTIVISTYQAGKLVLISPKNEDTLIQLPREFSKPMGIAENKATEQLALACKDEIIVFSNSPQLAQHYPRSPQKYDALYSPVLLIIQGPWIFTICALLRMGNCTPLTPCFPA